MRLFAKQTQLWFTQRSIICPCGTIRFRQMSSSEISAALRPFYFSVHPDLFGQYPSERAVNENSLQLLSSFIDNIRTRVPHPETTLTFYLKPEKKHIKIENLQSVKIKLRDKDIQKTVSSILSSCNLPTTYVDNLQKTTGSTTQNSHQFNFHDKKYSYTVEYEYENDNFRNIEYATKRTIQSQFLRKWLEQNIEKARKKLDICEPVREEIARLQAEISKALGIKQLILDCGWNIRHYRGCLASFQDLVHHHPVDMRILNGRTVVFGHHTGISLDGHVLLNSGEVRHNWLDLIKKIPKEEAVLLTLPSFEKSVSRVLRDINVVRRKFQPRTMAKNYENNLKRITTALSDHVGRYGYPKQWPESLSDYELVVETEAAPLMVSLTGQFIVPASCPSFLLVNFITEHLEEAKRLNKHYQGHKHVEKDLQRRCFEEFKLAAMEKDDSIPPDQMITCCEQLLRHKDSLYDLLKNSHLYVASYYSVMSDGQLCIPWNWKL